MRLIGWACSHRHGRTLMQAQNCERPACRGAALITRKGRGPHWLGSCPDSPWLQNAGCKPAGRGRTRAQGAECDEEHLALAPGTACLRQRLRDLPLPLDELELVAGGVVHKGDDLQRWGVQGGSAPLGMVSSPQLVQSTWCCGTTATTRAAGQHNVSASKQAAAGMRCTDSREARALHTDNSADRRVQRSLQ